MLNMYALVLKRRGRGAGLSTSPQPSRVYAALLCCRCKKRLGGSPGQVNVNRWDAAQIEEQAPREVLLLQNVSYCRSTTSTVNVLGFGVIRALCPLTAGAGCISAADRNRRFDLGSKAMVFALFWV